MSENFHLSYHPDSPYYGKEGYLGHLTPSQSDDLAELQKWMIDESIDISDLCLNYLSSKLVLLRYLRANKFSVAKAKAHILRNIEWRAEMNVKELINMHPSEILGCDVQDVMQLFPHWQSKFDRDGRPILYKQYGERFDATRIKEMSSMDALAKYHIWEQEACMRLCYEQSHETGYIIETVTGVVDVGGLQLSQLSRDLLAVIKIVAEIDQNQYPETMGQTFVINTSSVFPVVWRMVKPWLDPVVAGKIHLLGKPEEWTPLFDEHIDLRNVSVTYGGMQTALDVNAHPYSAICDEREVLEEDAVHGHGGRAGTILRRMMHERKQVHQRTVSNILENSDMLQEASDDASSTDASIVSKKSRSEELRYHPDSPYATQSGFLGSLTDDQTSALQVLQKWVIDNRIDMSELNMHALHPKLTLLRYLRANKWSTVKAIEHMERNLEWRREMGVKQLSELRPNEILGCEMSDLVQYFPHWQSGFDKFGRPVLYKQYNNSFDAAKILSVTTAEALSRYHIWEQEACMRLCHEQSVKTGHLVETLTAVIDVKGMQLYQVTSNFLAIMKSIADIDQNQYPETLGQTFIVNTPSVFPLVWRGVRPWLDPVVASKIQIFGQKESDWKAALDGYIGLAYVPSSYHGELGELNKDFHPYQSILGPLPGGRDGKGLSISDRVHAQAAAQKLSSDTHVIMIPRLGSDRSLMSETTVGSSAFGDALEGDSLGDYEGWGTELNFIRAMVKDVESGVDVYPARRGGSDGYSAVELDSVSRTQESAASSSSWAKRCVPSVVVNGFGKALGVLSKGCGALVPNFLLRQRKEHLRKWLTLSVSLFMVICLTCIGLTGYALSTMYWSSTTLVRVQMWSGVVVICMATILALLNFAGFVGSSTSNRPVLVLYSTFLSFYFVVFLVIAVICSVFATGDPRVTGLSNKALGKLSGEDVSAVLTRYNIILGTVSAILSIFSLVPLMLSTALSEVIKRQQDADSSRAFSRHSIDRVVRKQMAQFRVVVRIAQVVSIIIAFSMMGYGASALNFLLKIRFDYFVFSVYCLLYAGVTALISSAIGVWSSYSGQPMVVRFYYLFVNPLVTTVVLSTAALCCALLPKVEKVVGHQYEDLRLSQDEYSEEKVVTIVQIHLLVSGVLAFSAALFQIMCLSSVHGLYKSLRKWKSHCAQRSAMLRNKMSMSIAGASLEELNKMDQWAYDENYMEDSSFCNDRNVVLTIRDKLIVGWSILIGLIHIYFNGTYAMFAYRIVDSGSSESWFISLWKKMGRYDSRYTTADDFLVSTNGIMATVVGPLMLVYAWSIMSGRPFRQVCGIVINSVEVYTQILYFAIEFQNRFDNISVQDKTMFTLVFVLYNLMRVVIPVFIIYNEVGSVVRVVQQSSAQGVDKKENHLYEEIEELVPVSSYKGAVARPVESSNAYEGKAVNWAKYLNMRKRRNSIETCEV